MLTPRDIHRAEFKRVWKGYSPEEVDAFLRRVLLEYEKIYKENEALKEEVAQLQARLAEYSEVEVRLAQTLEMAQKAAIDTRSAAQKEAQAIIASARVKAAEVRQEAAFKVAEERRRLDDYVHQLETHRRALEGSLRQVLEYVEEGLPKAPQFEPYKDSMPVHRSAVATHYEGAASDDTEAEGADEEASGDPVEEAETRG